MPFGANILKIDDLFARATSDLPAPSTQARLDKHPGLADWLLPHNVLVPRHVGRPNLRVHNGHWTSPTEDIQELLPRILAHVVDCFLRCPGAMRSSKNVVQLD